MKMSDNINEIAAALSKAQGSMKAAIFNKSNPHFKSKFADLNSCIDACKQPLADNNLAVLQLPEQRDGNSVLITLLTHSSGQWITSEYPLLVDKPTSQAFGSAMTYAKRYSLCAMLRIVADEDDDGEASIDRSMESRNAKYIDPKKVVEANAEPWMTADQADELLNLAEHCSVKLLDRIKKHMNTYFSTQSYDRCPVSCYVQFKDSMEKEIAESKKEKAV